MTPGPTPEAFLKEMYYQRAAKKQLENFEEFIRQHPYKPETLTALNEANALAIARDPSMMLNREALAIIKKNKPEIYKEFADDYLNFLKEKAGLA